MKKFDKPFATGFEFTIGPFSVRVGAYRDYRRRWNRLMFRRSENPDARGIQVDVSVISIAVMMTADRVID